MAIYFLIGTYGYLNTITTVKAVLHKTGNDTQCDCCSFHGNCFGELTTQVEEDAWGIIQDEMMRDHKITKRSVCRWQSISIVADYE